MRHVRRAARFMDWAWAGLERTWNFVRPLPEMQELVESAFSSGPAQCLRLHYTRFKSEGLVQLLDSRKEACVNACGGRLLIPLDQFVVSFVPGSPIHLIRVQGPPVDQRWSLHSFDLSTEAMAALVCDQDTELCLCSWWPRSGQEVAGLEQDASHPRAFFGTNAGFPLIHN